MLALDLLGGVFYGAKLVIQSYPLNSSYGNKQSCHKKSEY